MGKWYQDLLVWQKARDLVVDVYVQFETLHDTLFKQQVYTSSFAVCGSLAYGYDSKEKTFKDCLYIAKGHCAEMKSLFEIAKILGYLDIAQYQALLEKWETLSKLLYGFIKNVGKDHKAASTAA